MTRLRPIIKTGLDPALDTEFFGGRFRVQNPESRAQNCVQSIICAHDFFNCFMYVMMLARFNIIKRLSSDFFPGRGGCDTGYIINCISIFLSYHRLIVSNIHFPCREIHSNHYRTTSSLISATERSKYTRGCKPRRTRVAMEACPLSLARARVFPVLVELRNNSQSRPSQASLFSKAQCRTLSRHSRTLGHLSIFYLELSLTTRITLKSFCFYEGSVLLCGLNCFVFCLSTYQNPES